MRSVQKTPPCPPQRGGGYNKKYGVNMKNLIIIFIILSILACANTPPPAQDRSRQAADAAFTDMDSNRQLTNESADEMRALLSQTSNTPETNAAFSNLDQPMWLVSPETVYDRTQYVTGIGHASTREMAERTALANLSAFFGQSIQTDQTTSSIFYETVRSGQTAEYSEDLTVQNTIRTQASLDTLIGAEIRDVWQDTQAHLYWAIAVMEKSTTAQVYSDIIRSNQRMIQNLTNMSATEKNTLSGYSRYLFSGVVADMNVTYSNLLTVIGFPISTELTNGNDYRLEAINIANSIQVNIDVKNDRANRLQGAFTKAFTDLGFRISPNNAQYVCEVDVSISPVDLPGNPNTFVRIEISANLVDYDSGLTLISWSMNERHGHANVTEAENRAFNSAESKVAEDYKNYLSTYLARLIPHM